MNTAEGPSGAQRVAAFLLSLDRPAAAAVMQRLDPAIVSEVAVAMSELDTDFADPEAVESLYRELAQQLHTPTGPTAPEEAELTALLESAYGPDRARHVVGAINDRNRRERPFGFIEGRPPELVARVLGEESAAVGALVLAHVPPELSGEVLNAFDANHMIDVVRRMVSIVPPGMRVLAAVATSLETRLEEVSGIPTPPTPAERQKTIAEMLKYSQPDVEKAALDGLEKDSEEVVAEIREFMFTWVDLAEVDKRAMQKILASVDTRTLAIALKGCPATVEDNIMGNLSARVRDMVADERELAGPTPMEEVLASRNEMLTAVRVLMESGEFRPARAGQDLVS